MHTLSLHDALPICKDDVSKRFITKNGKINDDKIVFLKIISNVIKSGMNILGVETPEKM